MYRKFLLVNKLAWLFSWLPQVQLFFSGAELDVQEFLSVYSPGVNLRPEVSGWGILPCDETDNLTGVFVKSDSVNFKVKCFRSINDEISCNAEMATVRRTGTIATCAPALMHDKHVIYWHSIQLSFIELHLNNL